MREYVVLLQWLVLVLQLSSLAQLLISLVVVLRWLVQPM